MKPTLAALAACALSAFIGWLSGYNFDHRDAGVAVWAAATVWFAFIAANLAADWGIA